MRALKTTFSCSEQYQLYSSTGAAAHFYHANGFPLEVYSALTERLAADFALSALKNRATWQGAGSPDARTSWATYADDLIAYLQQGPGEPIIAIGHSMGATATLIAAHKHPELFRALVLIEPAMLKPMQAMAVNLLPMALKQFIEPIRSTLRKPRHWDSHAAFRQLYSGKRAFRRFDDQALDLLAAGAVVPAAEGGVTLGFPVRWEAYNYANAMNVMPLAGKVKVPTVVIRGKPSVFFSEKMWQRWQAVAPEAVFLETPDYGHLLPLEAPDVCYQLVREGLAQLGSDSPEPVEGAVCSE